MFEEIISLENLLSAWENFRSGKRGREDVLLFERHLEDNLFWLHWDLKTGAYRHGPYHQFQIFDPKHHIIHKAAVRDRVLHHAIYRQLSPKFEPMFIFDSYSCRLNKGTHAAVRRLEGFARKASWNYTHPCWALKCDIWKFFNSINHEILLKLVGRKITDARTMKLLKSIILFRLAFPLRGVRAWAAIEEVSCGLKSVIGVADDSSDTRRFPAKNVGVDTGLLTHFLWHDILPALNHMEQTL